VFVCVAVAIGGWLALVLNADRENVQINFVDVYGLIGASGDPGDCPDVSAPPSEEAVTGARALAEVAKLQPQREIPNPNPNFGQSLPAANALTVATGSLRLCVGSAPSHDPGWDRLLAQMSG